MALLVYVDDLALAINNSQECSTFKTYLDKCFHDKDLGPLKYLLGVEVAKNQQAVYLCQLKRAPEIIEE